MKYKATNIGIMPEHWKVSTINDVTEVVTDYVANGSFASLAQNVIYKDTEDYAVLIRLVDYNNNFVGKFVFIDESAYEFLGKSKLFGGEIIISNVGANVGTVFRCPKLKYKMSLAPNAIMVRFKENNDFYFHWLKAHNGQRMLQSIVTGSAQPKFNKTNFREMLVPVPPIEEQNRIAEILNSIDNKIELNTAINNNLQQQIRALCSSWLEEYLPFDGKAPNDWVMTSLADIATFYGGYSYKGEELTGSTVAMATIKNFDRNGGFKADGFKEIIPTKLKPCHVAELFDTLVAHTDLTQNAEVIGNAEPLITLDGYDKIIYSMDLVKVLPSENLSKLLLAAILQAPRFKAHCMGYVNGTTVLHLGKRALPEYSILLPSDLSVLAPLDAAVSKLYRTMALNIEENRSLVSLRDTLLPKLMNGEIDVSNVDI